MKYLVPLNLSQQELQNARIQNLASAPSSPVTGQVYYDTVLSKFGTYNGATWDYMGTSGATGDFSSNTATAVDGEVVVFSGTGGKTGKRATGTGIAKLASGVLGTATSGTDYAPATSGSSALKGNGSGGFSAASLTDVAAPTADYSMSSHKLTNVTDPTTNQDAATKNYVDMAIQGIAWKSSVRLTTTANGTLASAYANGSTVDGVTLATNDRILIKNQTTGTENGIYTVNATGAPTRATDADTGTELSQAAVFVREGTTNAESAWVCSNDGTITIGTTAITFVQFSTAGGVQAATTTTAGISRYATTADANAKTVTTAAVTPAALATYTRTVTGTIGDGSTTSIAVTHSLGNQYVVTALYDASTNAHVEADVTLTSNSVVTFTFSTAPTTNQYRYVVVG